jgi:hypothetical protein
MIICLDPDAYDHIMGRVTFDTGVPHPARVYDYWLGGKDNFAADRQAAEEVLRLMPVMAEIARGCRLFLAAAVHYLAAEQGIRQFLDIGTGLPTANNTHQVAQGAAPSSRIVYVDNDPIVLSHAKALLKSDRQGRCAYIDADARDVDTVLGEAEQTLDFGQPVAVIMMGILHYIPEADSPYTLPGRYLDVFPAGSYLVASHASGDIKQDGQAEAADSYNARAAFPITMRTRDEFARCLHGLELVPPGITTLGQWAPGIVVGGTGPQLPTYTAVARKP